MRSLAVAALLALAHCDHAPPEPASPEGPRPVARAEGQEASKKPQKKRCIEPSPKTPPQPAPKLPEGACPRDPERAPPMVPVGKVAFVEAEAGPVEVEVELMRNDAHRARGLMYRTSLGERQGMLFAWERPAVRSFWMRDTCLSLDMLFIDEDGTIAGILEHVPPMNDASRSIDCEVPYVLEVNAGFTRKNGIFAGQRVRIDG